MVLQTFCPGWPQILIVQAPDIEEFVRALYATDDEDVLLQFDVSSAFAVFPNFITQEFFVTVFVEVLK